MGEQLAAGLVVLGRYFQFSINRGDYYLVSAVSGRWMVDRDQTVLGPRHYGNTLYQHFHSQHQYSLYSILFMFMCVLQSEHYSGVIVVKL